ncbi:hypothetical protein QVD17_04427 [Tagetes erecta]|uniref:Uncharacterized protein n=1 Tax=Tagetes erecta TaxID=13708 RepID=A0AAD8P9R2_TARER|nr:hypothetical protein QVD17_04427 [Tagetes erecta]
MSHTQSNTRCVYVRVIVLLAGEFRLLVMEVNQCEGLWQLIFIVTGAPVIHVIPIYFMITEAETDGVLFSHDSVWEDFQSKIFPILTCNLAIAEPILLNVSFKSSRSYTIQEAICRL